MRESWKRPGRWYLHKWPAPRAMASIKAKIRERTPRTIAHLPLERTVENLNPVLRGWGAYFRYGNSARKFATIDAYVNQRLAILASTKHGLRGWNRTTRFTHGWVTSLGVYRLTGNGPSHHCVYQPVNDVGEPCAGEPHARFDGGREETRPVG